MFKKNDYVLLFNNFHLKGLRNKNIKILEKSKVKIKNVLYNICGIIKEFVGSGIYLMVVAKDYKLYNLNKYDCCEVKNILIKKVDYEIWNDVLTNNV